MASIERSIEDMIEEAEETEAIEEVAPPKAKRPRSQKQIESLAKAREARAKNIAAKKQPVSVQATKPKKQPAQIQSSLTFPVTSAFIYKPTHTIFFRFHKSL